MKNSRFVELKKIISSKPEILKKYRYAPDNVTKSLFADKLLEIQTAETELKTLENRMVSSIGKLYRGMSVGAWQANSYDEDDEEHI